MDIKRKDSRGRGFEDSSGELKIQKKRSNPDFVLNVMPRQGRDTTEHENRAVEGRTSTPIFALTKGTE